MEKIIEYNIAALAVLGTVLLSAFFRGMTKGRANVSFILATAEVFITAVFGTFAIYFDNMGAGHLAEKWIFHAGYLFFHTITAAFYLIYLISLTDTMHRIRRSKLTTTVLLAPAAALVLLMIINCFTPVMFYIDAATGIYTRGSLFILNYFIGGFYLIYGVHYVFHYKKLFTLNWILTLFSPYPLLAVAMIVEFYNPHLVIELFVNAVVLLFVAYNIQRPEELIDVSTGLGNVTTYETSCRKAFLNKKPVREILIKITNYGMLRDVLSYDDRALLKRTVAAGITRVTDELKIDAELCYANNGQFYILVQEGSFGRCFEYAESLYILLNSPVKYHGNDIRPISSVCVIKIPEDISDFDSLTVFNHNFKDRQHAGCVLYASELLRDSYYDILLNIDRIIDGAIKKNGFEVYYQPIYSVNEKRFTTAEALLRLKDEKYGFVSPDIFIPAAEKSGAIHKIGEFVLNEVCRFIASDEFSRLGVDFIDVNLSAAECMKTDITERVCALLDSHGVPHDKICLEITETAVTQSPERLTENLGKLTAAGFRISLDDFGSGYSNIRRIANLPVGIVKLDKNFISERDGEKITVILEKLVGMLKALDMRIVAEGIETEETLARFVDLQCEYIQGFYYSRPVPKGEFVDFLTAKLAPAE